jgi:hypothetical protein
MPEDQQALLRDAVARNGTTLGAIGMAISAIGMMAIGFAAASPKWFPVCTGLQSLGTALMLIDNKIHTKAATTLYVNREAEKIIAGDAPGSEIPAINRELTKRGTPPDGTTIVRSDAK